MRRLMAYRMDSGLPVYWPDRVLVTDFNGNPIKDPITGEVRYNKHPKNGELYLEVPEEEYNKMFGFDGESKPYSNYKEWIVNSSPWERRKKYSPTFDQSGCTLTNFRELTSFLVDQPINSNNFSGYLKENIGNPRDPEISTQLKVED